MLRKAYIYDGKQNDLFLGQVLYNTEKDSYTIEVNKELTLDQLPWMWELIIKKYGSYTFDEYWSKEWIRKRCLPPNRQLIEVTLRSWGLTEYNEFDMTVRTLGRVPYDSIYVKEVFD